MKTIAYFLLLALTAGIITGCATEGPTPATQPAAATSAPATQSAIGVYDSRAVVLAYAGSDHFRAIGKARQAAYEQAKAAGDTAKMKEISDAAEALQRQFHYQAFGTAPVDNILEKYAAKIDALKEKQHLAAVVSKWDAAALKQYPHAKQINITNDLVDIIGTTAKQRRYIKQLETKKPLSNAELDKHFGGEKPRH